MLDQFRRFVESRNLLRPEDKVLLAVSGGIDSMVLLHLFSLNGYKVSVAHCNFRLRGKESDDDEAFVKKQCKSLGVPVYIKRFRTEKEAAKKKISVQMAAREERYAFFGQLREKHGFDHIVTAHNLDDMAETVLLHLVRGTGLAGLHGIVPKSGSLVRPLLFAPRSDIRAYARKEKIKWREDSSNRSDKYARNQIRQKVMPVLAKLNPSVLEAFRLHCEAAADAELLYREYVNALRKSLVTGKNGDIRIDTRALTAHQGSATLLYEILRDYGFNRAAVHDICHSLEREPGKVFFAPAYRLVKDRHHLLLSKLSTHAGVDYLIDEDQHHFRWDHGNMSFRRLSLTLDMKKKILDGKLSDRQIAWLDFDKLKFPLVLRKWVKGDVFHPLGMRGRKKLSDFFVDNKYSLVRKEKTWLLLSDGEIVWVVAERIDDRYKVTPQTRCCMEVIYHDK